MLGDVIFAQASAPGPAARAVLRVSGPGALASAQQVVRGPLPPVRAALEREVCVLGHLIPCLVLVMPGPRSYTGEDCVELHLPGSQLLLAEVEAQMLETGARRATPGEFTRRAFTHGRLDLAAAQAVHQLIVSEDAAQRRHAFGVLRGGLAALVRTQRATLLDAWALLESGLDFLETETGAVDVAQWQPAVAAAAAALRAWLAQAPQAHTGGEILLLGAANTGKSSLCNALAGRAQMLVGHEPGTTRDVIAVPLADGVTIFDAPGDLPDAQGSDADALALRAGLAQRAGAILLVLDAARPEVPPAAATGPVAAVVFTKKDLVAEVREPAGLPAVPRFVTSSLTGEGLGPLRAFLARLPRAAAVPGFAAAELAAAAAALQRASAARECPELAAAEVATALGCLDRIEGRSSPEDLLDRIFAGFCLGK